MLKLINIKTLATTHFPKVIGSQLNTRLKSQNVSDQTSKNKFKLIYKLPYIRHATIINKLKVLQGAVTAVAIPACGILQCLNITSFTELYVVSTIGITGCITLTIAGAFVTNLVGLIHINNEKSIVKIAYLDFWGERKNVEIPVDDIVPGSEIKSNKFFTHIKRYSDDKKFKLIKQHGIFLDEQDFDDTFGCT